MDSPDHVLLTRPLPNLEAWREHFFQAQIPVLASSAEALEALREREDTVDANLIGEMVAGDPLMTLRVLSYAGTHRPPRMVTDTGTVTAAVVMMGITPFFRAFGPPPTVEDRLKDDPAALEGIREVLHRSQRAATFALGFAVHRMDDDAALIHQAALLHDFAELLLWCHAPALALELAALKRADPTRRSSAAQIAVLNIRLADLQAALMHAWHLHGLLVRTADERRAEGPSERTVALAARMARHSAQGWENAALADDFIEVAELLNLSVDAAHQLVQDIGD